MFRLRWTLALLAGALAGCSAAGVDVDSGAKDAPPDLASPIATDLSVLPSGPDLSLVDLSLQDLSPLQLISPPPSPSPLTPPLAPPRYLSPVTTWTTVENVCLADGAPALAASRFTVLAARAQLPVVSAGPGCSWLLTFVAVLPVLDADPAAVWASAGDAVERFIVATTPSGGSLVSALYAVDARGARYAVDAAFATLSTLAPSPARLVSAAVTVDWPAMVVRGVVEGFYGPPFPDADRVALIDWMDEARENIYVYGPQNDDYSHADWFELYPDDALAAISDAAGAAASAGIDFVWAMRPGQGQFYPSTQPIGYASDDDFATLTAKIEQVRAAGVTRFGLFFDDNVDMLDAADMAMFSSLVAAQTFLINRLSDYLTAGDSTARLLIVGTDYSEAATDWQTYNQYFADNLRANVDVMWTGNETYSPTISAADLQPVTTSLGRTPVIWDNWPQFVTAEYGRSIDLPAGTTGLLSNPVICSWQHAPASSFAEVLGTVAMYTWRPESYDPSAALARWQMIESVISSP